MLVVLTEHCDHRKHEKEGDEGNHRNDDEHYPEDATKTPGKKRESKKKDRNVATRCQTAFNYNHARAHAT